MGKKYKNLYPKIYEFENLFLASRLARCGKKSKADVCDFEYDLERNLIQIQAELKDKAYRFSPYKTFLIKDPKERLIHAAPYRDRVVHHAICNVVGPILDKAMIFDSYACRIGKGSHRALNRAQQFLRQLEWVLKLDMKKYFFTIDHQILLRLITSKISDVNLLQMLSDLLATHESGDEYYFEFENDEGTNRERARGLPIGNLTSQILANFYLTPFDRFIKEQLKISKYLRYMDDCLIFGDNKQEMIKVKQAAKDFLADYRLKLHEQKSQIFPRRNGIRFLGFHIYPNYRRIQRENLIRFKKRWNKKREQYSKGDIDFNHLRLSLNGWLGYSRYYDTAQIINTLLQNYKFKKNDLNECDFSFYLPQG